MGWTCQHNFDGYCKLLKKECLPGIKGCVLQKSEYIFTTGSYEEDKKQAKEKNEQIDFAQLARSH
ncbi:hypothetical protein MNB_SM-3-1252 [hydrothermal vent metagenome]|uniref:Uncharacterized protein n=1 Tax=hydrothermal vent metagenome TaxID=652676 RepID=A0A1W1D3F2_9ZZZZ